MKKTITLTIIIIIAFGALCFALARDDSQHRTERICDLAAVDTSFEQQCADAMARTK